MKVGVSSMSSKFSVFSSGNLIDKVKEVVFFKQYANDDKVIQGIIDICDAKVFSKGSVMIKEGDSGDELFIILNGAIDVIKKTLHNEEYVVTTLCADSGGLYVGELGLIDQDKRSATVEAKTDCECIILKRDKFLDFGNRYPEVGLNITRAIAIQLSQKLRKTNSDVITLFSALVEEIAVDSVN